MLSTQMTFYAMYAARGILTLLFVLSFFSVAFFIERMIFFKRRFIRNFDAVAGRIERADSIRDVAAALSSARSAETDLLVRALDGRPASSEAFAQRVHGLFRPEREKWARYSTFLGSVGSNAPFIGLLGTVFGVLKAFGDLSYSTAGGPQVVMAGISEALIATAVGLLVAIPAVVFFNLCKVRVKKSTTHLQSLVDLICAREFFADARTPTK